MRRWLIPLGVVIIATTSVLMSNHAATIPTTTKAVVTNVRLKPLASSKTTSRKKLQAKLSLVSTSKVGTEVQFLELAYAIHMYPFLVCTRAHESDTAGGYVAFNPAGPWWGAYQFLQSTWDTTALHIGLPQFAGVNILQQNGFVQDVMALSLYNWQGKAPWGFRC